MAIVTPPARELNPTETRRRVHHPLQQLRGYIRLYVAVEGLAILALFLALWFWIGLVLDYGVFKAFTWDWVQETPWAFRAGLLAILLTTLLALLAVKVLVRLLKDFRDAALALVLERRFPQLLGDRLITAVELADPRQVAKYGFSASMVGQTIREAADRVGEMPVKEVFDWKRLGKYGVVVSVVTLGLYVAAAAGYCLVNWTTRVGEFVPRFNDVAAIWFERNILLANTIWPRRAYLELVDFPESGEIRVGRDAAPPPLRVRAFRWVVADPAAPEGWRALAWKDLNPGLLGAPVAAVAPPADWKARDADLGLTLDEIELQLDKQEVTGFMDADTLQGLRALFEQLEERAASPGMSRRLRKLVIPDSLLVYSRGATSRGEMTLRQATEREYAGNFTDLKESIRFTVRGEDYYTPARRVIVVPPPMLVELALHEAPPAYLYHRAPLDGEANDLRGLKQRLPTRLVSLTGATTRIEVPAGTDVVLTGKTDKPLRRPDGIRLLPPPVKGAADVKVSPTELTQPDDQTFQARFDQVRNLAEFVFEFTDTDNVVGRRHVVIKPVDDALPEVDVQVEVVRKTGQGYMVTPLAVIPFSGRVRDDHGLDRVQFAYAVNVVQSSTNIGGRAGLAAGVLQFLPTVSRTDLFLVPLYLRVTGRVIEQAPEEDKPAFVPLPGFARRLKERANEDVTKDVMLARIKGAPPQKPLLKEHVLDPANQDVFDLRNELPQLQVSEGQYQQRYRLRLGLSATDNNIETGPGTGQSKERFTFIVVSEPELLSEIAKEEEGLHLKMEDTLNRLKDSRLKLDQVGQDIAAMPKADEFGPLAIRAQEVEESVLKGLDVTREVFADYGRILKELRVNRVDERMVSKVENIISRLDVAINQDFIRAEEAQRDFHKTLEARKPDAAATDLAKKTLDQLIDRLQSVVDSMGEITTINRLIAALRNIEEGERKELERLKGLQDKMRDDIIRQVEGDLPESKPPKKP